MVSGLDSPVHLLVIVLLAVLLFGSKRLPEVGRALGTGMREFKISLTGDDSVAAAPELRAPDGQQSPPVEAGTEMHLDP